MEELAYLMDWDLQAIVRSGCSSEAPATIMNNPHPKFSLLCSQQDDQRLCNFSEFSETTMVFDELEELYKPFYPVLHPLSTQTIFTTTSSVPIPREIKISEEVVQDLQDPAVIKCRKRKKKQNKKVVKQVTADDLCDTWAWRKYGQKPIKGSPYPRSYYRCSSSKGCSARKQVERSHLDPGLFIISYTAEHSHPHPTRRNSLAGSTRKSKTQSAPENTEETCSPKSTAVLSPRTSLVLSIEDEVDPILQREGLKKGEDLLELLEDVAQGSDIIVEDEWFPCMEELDGLDQELVLDGCFSIEDTFDLSGFVKESNAVSVGIMDPL